MNLFEPNYVVKKIPKVLQGGSTEIIDLLLGGRSIVEFWHVLTDKDKKIIQKFCEKYNLNYYFSKRRYCVASKKSNSIKKISRDSSKPGYTNIRIFDSSLKENGIKRMNQRSLSEKMKYPDCCINKYFSKNNFSSLNPKNKVFKINFLVNPFPHIIANKIYCSTYLFTHIPCYLDCEKTKKKSKQILKNIKNFDKEFMKRIVYISTMPVIYFPCNISKITEDFPLVIFNGKVTGNSVNYTDFIANRRFFEIFRCGNQITIDENTLSIYKDESIVKQFRLKNNKVYMVHT